MLDDCCAGAFSTTQRGWRNWDGWAPSDFFVLRADACFEATRRLERSEFTLLAFLALCFFSALAFSALLAFSFFGAFATLATFLLFSFSSGSVTTLCLFRFAASPRIEGCV